MTIAVIIMGFVFAIGLLSTVGKALRQYDENDKVVHERELKGIKEKAEELKQAGIIASTYDFMVGVNYQKNESN